MQTFRTHIKIVLYLNGFQNSIQFPVFRVFAVSHEQLTMHNRSENLDVRMTISEVRRFGGKIGRKKKTPRRPSYRWVDNTKMGLTQIGQKHVN